MTRRGRRTFWGMVAIGTVLRLGVAFSTFGLSFDIESYLLTFQELTDGEPFHLYADVNEGQIGPRWPYPGGYLPFVLMMGWLADWTGLPFHGTIQLPPIAADAALAWLVQWGLGRAGATERVRLLGAGLVALGPGFAAISGYHGQLDAVAILPVVAAVLLWTHGQASHRAVVAGILIGLGGAMKGVPLIGLLALYPTARSWREAATVSLVAGGICGLSVAPFLVADLHGTLLYLRRNHGLPGLGGISLLVQPELSRLWLGVSLEPATALTVRLWTYQPLIASAVALAAGAIAFRARLSPVPAAALIWFALLAFGVNFAFQYVVWGLPFFLLHRRFGVAAALQFWLIPPLVLDYLQPDTSAVASREYLYVPLMVILWLATVVWCVREVRDARRLRSRAEPLTPTTA